jgi:hypothetical protein
MAEISWWNITVFSAISALLLKSVCRSQHFLCDGNSVCTYNRQLTAYFAYYSQASPYRLQSDILRRPGCFFVPHMVEKRSLLCIFIHTYDPLKTKKNSKMAVFWVAPCGLVEVYQRFRGPCCLYHQSDEAARTSETSVNFYQTTRRYNPEDSHLRTHRREKLKSYLKKNSHKHRLKGDISMLGIRTSRNTLCLISAIIYFQFLTAKKILLRRYWRILPW